MKFADRDTVERLRKEYPAGCRIVLDEMDDPYTKIPVGTQGTCQGVDDGGNILCHWDSGSSLSVAWGADRCHKVSTEDEVKVSLDWLGKQQEKAEHGGHCPRCGAEMESFSRHAISRYADVTVCDQCGTFESLECAGMLRKKPLTAWVFAKEWKL